MHVRTLFPSNITSQEEQEPCLQLNESLRPDLTHARLRGCPDCIWIVFPLSRLATDTFNFRRLEGQDKLKWYSDFIVRGFRTSFSAASDKILFALLMPSIGWIKASTVCMAKHATIIETVQTIILSKLPKTFHWFYWHLQLLIKDSDPRPETNEIAANFLGWDFWSNASNWQIMVRGW
jgi:hypothetical protein